MFRPVQKAGSPARRPDLALTQKWVPTCQSNRSSTPKLERTQAHTRIRYTHGLGGCSTPNRIFCVPTRGGRSVPGTAGAGHRPPLEEIKLLCRVVYATRQGTGINQLRTPKPSPLPCTPIAPRMPTSIKCLRGGDGIRSGSFNQVSA